MKAHRILPEALAELEQASTWYEEQREGLGLALVAEYRQRLESALARPRTASIAGKTPGGSDIRRFRLKHFRRYAILLATIHGVPTVLAFEHSSRKPGYWRDRLK